MSQKGGFMATQEQGAEMIAREDMTEIMGTEQIPAEAVLPGSAGAAISSGGSGNFGMQQNGSYPQIIPNSPTFQVPANPLLLPEYNELLDYNAVQYLNGIFRTQIGRYVKVSQLVGSNTMEEFEGYLIGVGINYVILQDYLTGNIRILDIYGIKSMYVYYKNVRSMLSSE